MSRVELESTTNWFSLFPSCCSSLIRARFSMSDNRHWMHVLNRMPCLFAPKYWLWRWSKQWLHTYVSILDRIVLFATQGCWRVPVCGLLGVWYISCVSISPRIRRLFRESPRWGIDYTMLALLSILWAECTTNWVSLSPSRCLSLTWARRFLPVIRHWMHILKRIPCLFAPKYWLWRWWKQSLHA
jgi:hypothetical protein